MKVETYLINLDGSDQRLTRATEQLQAVNWVFERFSAYDGRGKDLSSFQNYDDKQTQQQLGRRLLNSELGCYLSHYGCAEKFLKSDADYLVVLEENMKITLEFKASVDTLLNYLDSHKELDWYLINLAAKKKKLAKDIKTLNDFTL